MEIMAGKTGIPVNTRVRITKLTDDENPELIGKTGVLTHPFPGLMFPGVNYIAGVWLDSPVGAFGSGGTCNLEVGDKFEIVEGGDDNGKN